MGNYHQDSLLSHKDFVAIDVEYANSIQSICQVGLAIVRDLRVVDWYRWLIQPPGNYYEKQYTNKHGITPADTADAPFFEQVWPEIWEHLCGELSVYIIECIVILDLCSRCLRRP